jgi:hypothetical protein
MNKNKTVVFLVLGAALLSSPLNSLNAAEPNPIDELKECARTEKTKKRVACYEALGKRVLGEEVKTDAPEPPTDAANAFDDLDDEYIPILGHVKSCQEASDRRWFFILDDGEVWKQSGGRTRRFKDCDFDVIIRKDVFGYKMEIAGDDQKVRVKRHK